MCKINAFKFAIDKRKKNIFIYIIIKKIYMM